MGGGLNDSAKNCTCLLMIYQGQHRSAILPVIG